MSSPSSGDSTEKKFKGPGAGWKSCKFKEVSVDGAEDCACAGGEARAAKNTNEIDNPNPALFSSLVTRMCLASPLY
jgi:hypothetical protein